MNRYPRTSITGALADHLRGLTHALILVAIGLAIGLGGLESPTAAAQGQSSPLEATAPAEPTPDVGTSPDPVPSVPGDVQMRVGETATLDDGALDITFVGVVEDSRCPQDVMCVWAGRAIVAVHVVVDGVDRGEVNVTHYHGSPQTSSPDHDATVDRYVISLVDLQPYPAAGNPQPLDQRVATICVAPATP